MERTGVLVSVSGPDPKQLKTKHHQFFLHESGTTTLSCSGLVLRNNTAAGHRLLVATTAWVLAPFLKEGEDEQLLPLTRITCAGEEEEEAEEHCHRRRQFRLVRIVRSPHHHHHLGHEWLDPRVRGISQFDVAVLEEEEEEPSASPSPLFHAVSEFGVCFDTSDNSSSNARSHRGERVDVVSSAFGLVYPAVFRNSITRGVLCNVLKSSSGRVDVVYFTDARCAAGSEGGAAFLNGQFLGMVLPALHLRGTGEAPQPQQRFELAAILPLPAELLGGGQLRLVQSPTRSTITSNNNPLVSAASQSVALLKIGQNWGSGVLVSVGDSNKRTGHLLTCAHVVGDAQTCFVQFRRGGGDEEEEVCRRTGRVVFCSDGPIDVAVVEVPALPAWVRAVTLSSAAGGGQACSAIGYSLFEPNSSHQAGTWATISSGNVCRVVALGKGRQAVPCMLQTCTPVFRGHSGGLLSDQHGRMLGLITSNARQSTGAIIPEINFAIPLHLLLPIVRACQAEADGGRLLQRVVGEFAALTKQSLELRGVWALTPPPDSVLPLDARFRDFFASEVPVARL